MALEGALENQLLGHDEGILEYFNEVRLVLRGGKRSVDGRDGGVVVLI